jgi:CRISPR system Cascade subunit CasB
MSEVDEVQRIVSSKIRWLSVPSAQQRAALAKLRRGIGKEPGEMPEVWDITLAELPESLTRRDGVATRAEQAIHVSLTLFALHQQGKSETVSRSNISFGAAVRQLVTPDKSNEQAIKRRFDAAITAKEFAEFSHHARGFIQLMKANKNNIFLDYPKFARDLYWLQNSEQRTKIMLRWGQDFWTPGNIEQDEDESQEQDQAKNQKENREGVQQ